MSYMLDTNTCSFLIRRRPPAVAARLAAAEQKGQVFISVVVAYELLRGVLGRQRFGVLVDAFLARATVMPWDQQAAARAAQVHYDLTTQGKRIGENDTMIAGHALAAGCTLVTKNTREFARVAGLKMKTGLRVSSAQADAADDVAGWAASVNTKEEAGGAPKAIETFLTNGVLVLIMFSAPQWRTPLSAPLGAPISH